jgi:hypothetical protein
VYRFLNLCPRQGFVPIPKAGESGEEAISRQQQAVCSFSVNKSQLPTALRVICEIRGLSFRLIIDQVVCLIWNLARLLKAKNSAVRPLPSSTYLCEISVSPRRPWPTPQWLLPRTRPMLQSQEKMTTRMRAEPGTTNSQRSLEW